MPSSPSSATKELPLCFVIGPIGKDGTIERKHADLLLHAVIKDVLEDEEFGYRVKRADEDADPGMITDRIVTDITRADLVVADLTDLNPNVFYELGIRHSKEGKTIHVAKTGTTLPFDTLAHRTIFVDLTDWHSQEKARLSLAEAVRATRRPDYKVSNPITQANASFQMRESSDPRDRVMAELSQRVAALEYKASTDRSISNIPPPTWLISVTTSAKNQDDMQRIFNSIAKLMPVKMASWTDNFDDKPKELLLTYEPTIVGDVVEVRRRVAEWGEQILKLSGVRGVKVNER